MKGFGGGRVWPPRCSLPTPDRTYQLLSLLFLNFKVHLHEFEHLFTLLPVQIYFRPVIF